MWRRGLSENCCHRSIIRIYVYFTVQSRLGRSRPTRRRRGKCNCTFAILTWPRYRRGFPFVRPPGCSGSSCATGDFPAVRNSNRNFDGNFEPPTRSFVYTISQTQRARSVNEDRKRLSRLANRARLPARAPRSTRSCEYTTVPCT